jgi:hypothetical protein
MHYLDTNRNAEGESTCLARKGPAGLPQRNLDPQSHNQPLLDSHTAHTKRKHTPINKHTPSNKTIKHALHNS